MLSDAKLSPKNRGVVDLEARLQRLAAYEQWKEVKPLELVKLVGYELWWEHWNNLEKINEVMKTSQALAEKIKAVIAEGFEQQREVE